MPTLRAFKIQALPPRAAEVTMNPRVKAVSAKDDYKLEDVGWVEM